MKKILHIVNQSPFHHQALHQCLTRYKTGDSILLMGDGVYGAINSHNQAEHLGRIQYCYALQDDIDARGIEESHLLQNIHLINDNRFVELSVEHPLSHSWF